MVGASTPGIAAPGTRSSSFLARAIRAPIVAIGTMYQRAPRSPPQRGDQPGADQQIHDRADDQEEEEQIDEVRAFGALAAERVLDTFAPGKEQRGADDEDGTFHGVSGSFRTGSRRVWVIGGALLISSARAETASLRTCPDSERT